MTDWRYWVTFSGVVTADTEDQAMKQAQDDVDNGRIPEIEVEEIEGADDDQDTR
jgi:hypothetical protein